MTPPLPAPAIERAPSHPERAGDPLHPHPAAPDGPLDALARRLDDRSAMVAIVGLGYVGLPLLIAADSGGFGLIGLDVDPAKVNDLRARRSYLGDVTDEDLAGLDRVQFTTDHRVLVAADVIIMAVPTPLRDGGPDLSLVRAASEDVARVLRPGQLVVLESTTYPGTPTSRAGSTERSWTPSCPCRLPEMPRWPSWSRTRSAR
jgi:threonine dehydrogenase-like Zn-dependent dehydrogenase